MDGLYESKKVFGLYIRSDFGTTVQCKINYQVK